MRRLTKARTEDEAEINITPMLDVVFIMLIFFIVTASFIKESGISVNKPEAQTSEKKDNTTILVAINDRDEIWIDRRLVDPRAVKPTIVRLRAENPEGAVVVQADLKSTTEAVMAAVDGIRDAGVPLPTIATTEASR